MKKAFLKKSMFIIFALILLLIFGWRIYQENVPSGMKNRINKWKNEQNTIVIFDENGNNVTQQFFSDNEWNYKLKNYKSIYDYIKKMGNLAIDYGS